jgi:cellulose synthase/poly-beta-1,6-N-acetylglucosamine synthase-like glycosyltransferase
LLAHTLRSLTQQECDSTYRVVVIDNDPSGSAKKVVVEFEDQLMLEYAVEPEPGIVAARNAFLARIESEEFIAFIDDDETAAASWLQELLTAAERFSADVVAGPVIPILPATAPRWAAVGGFFERSRHVTGTKVVLAATNNALVRRSMLLRMHSPRFNPAFSSTGGSDSELFARLHDAGASIVWCNEAVVSEEVPEARISWHWVARRAQRTGNVRARLLLERGRWARTVIEGIGRVCLGSVKCTYRIITFRKLNAWSLNTLCRGIGMLSAIRGVYIHEYKRAL